MKPVLLSSAVVLLLAALSFRAHASSYQFTFTGPGVNGNLLLTYGTATDLKYPQAYEVTGISGSFTDTNIGINNATVTGLEALNRISPESTNLLAPNDFSGYAVASGLPPENNGLIHYDNLFYPAGSPQTASSYPPHGGLLDIYGLLFDIGNNEVVDLWSAGDLTGTGTISYGVAVATHATSLAYTSNVTAVTPEPGTFWLLGTGIAAVLSRRHLLSRTRSIRS